jgi:cell division protein FtsI (penicillin-binding protein 3)
MNPRVRATLPDEQAWRIRRWGAVLVTSVAVALLAPSARIAWLKIATNDALDRAAGTHRSDARELAERGQILDRRGRVLATSLMSRRVFVDPALVWEAGWDRVRKARKADPDSEATADPFRDVSLALGSALGISPTTIEAELRRRAEDRYHVVAEGLTDVQVAEIRALNLKGVGIESHPERIYPAGDIASQVVGRIGTELRGQSGAELAGDRSMQGEDGNLAFLRDARMRPLWIDERGYRAARDGEDIRLSIDLVIQEIAERNLREAVKDFHAGGARCVVMDVDNGDILAIADVLSPRRGWQEVTTDPSRSIHPSLGRNRNVTDPYEPGSTFKPFVWAVATELGKFKPESVLPLGRGPYRTPFGRTITDVKYYGPVSWKTVLMKSLNLGMVKAAERMTFAQMQDAVRRFGFGHRTDVGIPGESEGRVTRAKDWSKYTQTSVCMGYEISVTPVQMVQAFSSFCRDGTMVPARLILGPDAGESPLPVQARRVLPEPVALEAREAMEGVVTEGTGRKAQSDRYRMFGKSGTAHLVRPKGQGKGYFDDRYTASFIAAAPYRAPRVVCLVVIDDPDKAKGHFGGSIAGPVCRDVIDETLEYMGVAPDQDPAKSAQLASIRREPERH